MDDLAGSVLVVLYLAGWVRRCWALGGTVLVGGKFGFVGGGGK